MTRAASRSSFVAALADARLLVPLAPAGLYGFGAGFEAIVRGIENFISARGADLGAEPVRFPGLLPFWMFERTDYVASFPDLLGAVFTFAGGEAQHAAVRARHERGEDWRDALEPSGLMLVSAACQPLFATLADRVLAGRRYADVLSHCFRHEESQDPMRMQAFRQREFVCVGDPGQAMAHRQDWTGRGLRLLRDLGLEVTAEAANDPFFGRAGRLLADQQREAGLKTELTLRLSLGGAAENGAPGNAAAGKGAAGHADDVALASVNYHSDHFGRRFAITLSSGGHAHSACVGFGLERITLALLWVHGLDTSQWPGPVRALLCL